MIVLTVETPGYEFDKAVEAAVGEVGEFTGAGMFIMGGMRDMDYSFDSREEAAAAAERVKKAVPSAVVNIYDEEEE